MDRASNEGRGERGRRARDRHLELLNSFRGGFRGGGGVNNGHEFSYFCAQLKSIRGIGAAA